MEKQYWPNMVTVTGADHYGKTRGFWGVDFKAPLEELARGFQGDSDRFTMLWMVYEEGYYEGQLLRERIGA